ncbi:cation-transporting P-type ATPase [Limosilactobacillus fermentum]|uniref:cation-transporting P-type ATPase n=1 Tax=Limosilactobacillus fermentum TaxID=1613 RepID=UPI002F264F39
MADEVKTSGVDLEKAPLDQVMQELGADAKTGLSASEAQARLQKYGANALEEKEESFTHKLVHAFMGPIEYMIEAAAIIGHWDDFIIIMLLLIFNVTIDLWQSQKASSALAALKKGMAPQANALRDGKYQTIDAATLVPGDIIKIRLGLTPGYTKNGLEACFFQPVFD